MKDITDYFTSPSKSSVEIPLDSGKNSSVKTSFKFDFNKVNKPILTNIENSSKSKTKREKQKIRKSRRAQRKSDPAVKNITELLSNSLSLISPNTSINNTLSPTPTIITSDSYSGEKTLTHIKYNSERGKQNESTKKEHENSVAHKTSKPDCSNSNFVELSNNVKSLNDEIPTTGVEKRKSCNLEDPLKGESNEGQKLSNKVNVFQFMMDSRNKSIGQNSSGKEASDDEDDTDTERKKKKRASLKNTLQNWAEKKGASKRKREDEERDEIINYKLEKRAKHLRKLLKAENVDSDDFETVHLRKRRLKRISSSSSDSCFSVNTENNLRIIKKHSEDQELHISKTESNKPLVSNHSKVDNINDKEQLDSIADLNKKEIIKIKMFTTKTVKKKSDRRLKINYNEIEKNINTNSVINPLIEQETPEKQMNMEYKKSVKEKQKINTKDKSNNPKTHVEEWVKGIVAHKAGRKTGHLKKKLNNILNDDPEEFEKTVTINKKKLGKSSSSFLIDSNQYSEASNTVVKTNNAVIKNNSQTITKLITSKSEQHKLGLLNFFEKVNKSEIESHHCHNKTSHEMEKIKIDNFKIKEKSVDSYVSIDESSEEPIISDVATPRKGKKLDKYNQNTCIAPKEREKNGNINNMMDKKNIPLKNDLQEKYSKKTEKSIDTILKRRGKRKISSSSSDSLTSLQVIETGSICVEQDSQDSKETFPETKPSWQHFFGTVNKSLKNIEDYNKSEVFSAKEIIKIKMFTPKNNKKKSKFGSKTGSSDLLSNGDLYSGETFDKDTTTVKNPKELKTPKKEQNKIIVKNKKNSTKHLKKLLKEDTLNNDDEDFESPIVKKPKEFPSSPQLVPKNDNLKIEDEDAQEAVVNISKSKVSKDSFLTFFGAANKPKTVIKVDNKECDEMESIKETEVVKIKMVTPKIKKKHSKTKDAQLETREDKLENKINTNHSQGYILTADDTPETKSEKVKHKSKTPKTTKIKSFEGSEKEPKEKISEIEKSNFEKRVLRSSKNESIIYVEADIDEHFSNAKHRNCHSKNKKETSNADEFVLSSDSDDDSQPKKKTKKATSKPLKVAPVFVKAAPKPKLDPEVVEARKQFLMSGIPSSLKKVIEKQHVNEEREYDIFPKISHIQQKCETDRFWNLPEPNLNIKENIPLKIDAATLQCNCLTNSHINTKLNIQMEVEKVDMLKTLLNKIKTDNPNYPVYKSFRLIYEKSGKDTGKHEEKRVPSKRKKSRKRQSKSADKSMESIELLKTETENIEHAMWTEKYKPKCSDDIIGNSESVNHLKKWLQTWMNFSQEINARKKRRNEESTSESEFDTTDCDSRDSIRLPGNTVVLGGPCGSGKSVAVYAVCNELGFNLIELNASSKRTGKRLLQELQEATQSHQVRKGESFNSHNFFQANKSKELSESKDQQADKRMCVLLIEDIDLVFEQDDGFIHALSQLVTTSKRPIILTTTDYNSIFIQKYANQYEYISFLPLTSNLLATWLQIVCLVEGLYVNQGDIGALLEYNKGDVRKTLLELQFWVHSGGQIIREDKPLKIKNTCIKVEEKLGDDEQLIPGVEDRSEKCVTLHSNCISSFEIFNDHKTYTVPYYINLGLIWWNLPKILNIPNFAHERLNRINETKHVEKEKEQEDLQWSQLSVTEKRKFISVQKLYDSLAFTDVMFRKTHYFDGMEPYVNNCSSEIMDSLELNECMINYDGHLDFVHEVTHTLVNGYVEEYNTIDKGQYMLNMGVPERIEKRWRAKHQVCKDVFQEALSLSSHVERKALALDYLPCLRNISRSESHRASVNTKRGNRFRNYLKGLNITYNDNTVKLACNILRTENVS